MGPTDKQERTGAPIGSPHRDGATRDATDTTDVRLPPGPLSGTDRVEKGRAAKNTR